MEELNNYLGNIGLTKSEIKVYLALIKIGESSKGEIVKNAGIAASKVYDVLDKLIEKGLVSYIVKNNVKYFKGANPKRINDYIKSKKMSLIEQEQKFNKFLPSLENIYESLNEESLVEVYKGWKGLETIYGNLVSEAKKDECFYIFGAGKSEKELQLDLFFSKYRRIALEKGVKTKIIFNESARDYILAMEKNIGEIKEKRFLFNYTPTEVIIHKDNVLMFLRKVDPIIIYIKDKETAESFLHYFNELWKNASKE